MAEPELTEGGDGGLTGEDFPAGMKVLAVDDDPTCLRVLCGMLRKCRYHVTQCGDAKQAIQILRAKKRNFDLVITDVSMPDMDGFKLLELVGLEMDLPVIMISIDLSIETVKKSVLHGACDFISKPIKLETAKYIWHHVLRRKKPNNDDDDDNNNKNNKNESALRSVKKRKEATGEDQNGEETGDDGSRKKKKKAKRFQWTKDLQELFVDAVRQLGGINGAVPKKILNIMNIPGLTREHVASHLQKHRQSIQKLENAEKVQLLNNQPLPSQTLTGQTSRAPYPKPLRYCTYSKSSSLLPMQNSINAPGLLTNSHNMPLPIYSRQQQQPPNNFLISQCQQFGNELMGINNGLTDFGSGASASQFGNRSTGFGSVFFNNDGNMNSNGNGLMGMGQVGCMPTRYGMDGMESPNSNLTYSNNGGEILNNLDNLGYNGRI